MKTVIIRTLCTALALLCLGALPEAYAATVRWSVVIAPTGGGSVAWTTSSPAKTGVLNKSGTLVFDSGAYVDLTIRTQSGFQLTALRKNADDILTWLDGNRHVRFGPVGSAHVIVAIFSVVNPTGDFPLNFPDGKATGMVDITGHYTGTTPNFGHRAYTADIAMDESGKLTAMGNMAGVVPKAGGPITASVGSLRTLNGTPSARLSAGFTGTVDGNPATASGAASGPLTLTSTGGGNYKLNGVASGRSTVNGTRDSSRASSGDFPVTGAQAANTRKAWNLALKFREVVGPTGKKTVYASSILTLPTGARTSFKERRLTFSVRNGYSTAFSLGTKIDGVGNPILDAKGKPVIDRKSKIKVIKMRVVGTSGHWIVTNGVLSYSFLGQKGKGNPKDFIGTEQTLLDNGNVGGVINNPTVPTTFSTAQGFGITYLSTYHWNNGKGARPGTLSIRAADGTTYGPWKTTGLPGQGGVRNAYWECRPSVYLPPGTYTVIDSAPLTWSQNPGSGGRGFARVLGKP